MNRITTGTALIIGGGGFLGRHVTAAFEQAGLEVVPVRRGSYVEHGPPALELLSGPAGDLRAVLESTHPTVVVNAAGVVDGSARQLVDGNVVAPVRLLTAMASAAPTARYVHLGSAAEYGSAAPDRSVGEDDDPAPLGAYGVSKLAGTRAVLELAADAGLTAVVLRVFNPVGPGSPASSLPGRLAHLLREASDGRSLSVGPLDAFRDFVDVRDVGRAVVACSRATLRRRLYNIGSGKATGSRELAERLVDIAGFRGTVHEESPPSTRSGALLWQQADISRAAADLDWSPGYDLTDSLIDLWRCTT